MAKSIRGSSSKARAESNCTTITEGSVNCNIENLGSHLDHCANVLDSNAQRSFEKKKLEALYEISTEMYVLSPENFHQQILYYSEELPFSLLEHCWQMKH